MGGLGLGRSCRAGALAALAALAALFVLTGCGSASSAASTAGGAHLDDDGRLVLQLGAACSGIASIEVTLETAADREIDVWALEGVGDDDGAAGEPLTALTLGEVPEGFVETDPLEVSWLEADTVWFRLRDVDREPVVLDYVSVRPFADEAGQRLTQWYVEERGWLTKREYRALANPDDLVFPFCSVPDPPAEGQTWEDVISR